MILFVFMFCIAFFFICTRVLFFYRATFQKMTMDYPSVCAAHTVMQSIIIIHKLQCFWPDVVVGDQTPSQQVVILLLLTIILCLSYTILEHADIGLISVSAG